MEEFKKLKWSWNQYDEEKKSSPRVFDFETISDRDPLMRTLNEVHVCVLPPPPDEYRLFKTPEEIAGNSFEQLHLVAKNKDPRTEVKILKNPLEQIEDYGYSSELTKKEQIDIISGLKSVDTQYNPRKVKIPPGLKISKPSTISATVDEKWKKEIAHFNKCAEIHFHRHITEFNNLISSDLKSFLLNHWSALECDLKQKFQAITMILRQKTWNKKAEISVEFVSENAREFAREFFIIPKNFFPPLHRHSIERLKLYEHQNRNFDDDPRDFDIEISLRVLSKLFVDGNEFSIAFKNEENGTRFLSNEVVPVKMVNPVEALEDVLEKALKTEIEWFNIDKALHKEMNQTQEKTASNPLIQVVSAESFKANKIDAFMSQIYSKYKKDAGQNFANSVWTIKKDQHDMNLKIFNELFYVENDISIVISIKLEFQTKFGAEKMTKEELLKEWIELKFSKASTTLRYRIDAATLQILSITKITVENIENELQGNFDSNPFDALEIIFNMFSSIKNLPHGDYLIQAKIGIFNIYKSNDNGKEIISQDEIKINPTFTRKWTQIDHKFPTYIHMQLRLAPCCFPIAIGQHKRATSYTLPVLPTKPQKEKPVAVQTALKKQIKKSKRKKKKTQKFGQ